MRFTPHVTVATVVEHNGRFLLVEEIASGRQVLNQPAGHLDANETLLEAALRETLEETGWQVELTGVVGIYLYTAPANGVTYQRVCFAAKAIREVPGAVLDDGILGPRWLTRDELLACREQWRSHLLLECIDDYLAGHHYPLSLVRPVSHAESAAPA